MTRLIIAAAVVLGLAACGSSGSDHTASTTGSAPASSTSTSAALAPPAPTNPSTLETAGVKATVLLEQTGTGSATSTPFAPTGNALVRIRVEWACAPGATLAAHVADARGEDISGPLENGFDGPIPVDHPPARVVFKATGACSWHVRALDQS